MIHLIMNRYPDGTSCPVSLEINNRLYNYSESSMFSKLSYFINENILCTTLNVETAEKKEKTYVIRNVFKNENDIWTLDLGDYNETC